MSEYIIHNVLFDINRKLDFDGDEETDKPIDKYPNHYLGKVIGPRETNWPSSAKDAPRARSMCPTASCGMRTV